tara:strand:+ start:1417 stop:1632 length:216 start_codon:yes stop_codon:yes gene_type:complete
MKRRKSIKGTIVFGMGLAVFPQIVFKESNTTIPNKELIGKSNPELFGEGYKLRKKAYDTFLIMSDEALKST